MWHAQLTPIDRYGDWLDLVDQSTNDGGEDFPAVAEYLRATQPLVELMAEP